ncbi:TIM barrel protein, partial [Deinococcus pimensis]|uniref:TIM barrel protein n=1 Tax=Deinococcus pimensis TaxID=309888 RepID=UPI001FDF2F1B
MPRPVTLFTGQWADLPLAELAPLARSMGYDGLELACWGDHVDVRRAAEDDAYVRERRELLADHGLALFAISNHLVGQAVCDLIDERHRDIVPEHVWGDGDPEGVRRRAAEEMILTGRAAARLGVKVVNGFTGSSIWHSLYAFPPTSTAYWQRGFEDFARRWTPILEAFDAVDVNFGLEVHPTEIAFDVASARQALDAVGNHPRFGFNYDPSHLGYQGVDYVKFLRVFPERIFHVHMKDVWWGRGDGEVGVFGGHRPFGDAARYWDFRSVGRGDIDFEAVMVALNDIGYAGPLSVEWEDARMDRVFGAAESAAFTRRLDFPAAGRAFDSAFAREQEEAGACVGVRLGMVGGGEGAFIGAVHRMAAALNGQYELVAGALSGDPERARRSGAALGLNPARSYASWREMLGAELALPEGERIEVVSVVTPNHVHHEVARAFASAGVHVVCDKPLVHTSEQARDLVEVTERAGVVFAVTYNYTGYPMVREARALVRSGALGEIRKVIVEYNQGWLATKLEEAHNKQADWRTDPERSGIAGAVGDIGSHAENLVATVTGLEIESICADLTTFVPGRRLDDDANLLLRFVGGARGVLWCSQIQIGDENDLRLRVFGTKGSLHWHQEDPNVLRVDLPGEPRQLRTRGSAYLSDEAKAATRLPSGHPEAFLEAFANVYRGAAEAIRARTEGRAPDPLVADFPTVLDGAR